MTHSGLLRSAMSTSFGRSEPSCREDKRLEMSLLGTGGTATVECAVVGMGMGFLAATVAFCGLHAFALPFLPPRPAFAFVSTVPNFRCAFLAF